MDYSAAPRATPLLDRNRVYVQSAFGEFYCLDLKSGNTVWQKDFVKDLGAEKVPTWGYSSSPLLAQGRLIVNPAARPRWSPWTHKTARSSGKARAKEPTTPASSWQLRRRGPGGGLRHRDAGRLGTGLGRATVDREGQCRGRLHRPDPVAVGGRLLVADSQNEARLFAFEAGATIRKTPVARSQELAPEIVTPIAAGDLVLGQSGRLVGLAAENLRALWTDEKEKSFEPTAI